MYKHLKTAVVIPCYNEEKLAAKTIEALPDSIDYIIAINDASKDKTLEVLKELEKKHKKLTVLDNEQNGGIGYTLKRGFQYLIKNTDAEAIGIVSGDAQCDPAYIEPMFDDFIKNDLDYVKGNRFFQREALKAMPTYRRLGNIFVSILTKFSTGYYTISDTQMGFGFLSRRALELISYDLVRDRYDYENSMLVALSIVGAKVKDHAVPAIYGEETSTIDFWPTVFRTLRTIWVGFWQRIYYKYILYSFHPIALFLLSGLALTLFGLVYGTVITYTRIASGITPSTGTVMIAALPLFLGFQLLLTAVTMDMNNEGRS